MQQMQRTPPGSSRRARFEEKKVMQQTLIIGVVAIVLCVLFVIVVIPAIVRFIGGRTNTTVPTTQESSSVQTPFLSAPVTATSSASITLSGYGEKGDLVVVLDNDQELKRVNTNDDGSFSAAIQLSNGNNNIAVYQIKNGTDKSTLSQTYPVLFDTTPPKLDISEPSDGQNIQGKKNQNMTIKGQSDPTAKIFVNGRLVSVGSDGSFTTLVFLSDGANALDIQAVSQAGNMTEKKLTVNFSE